MKNSFLIREHPVDDRVMIQIDNEKIELDREDQEKIYNYLKKRLKL